MYDLSHVCEEWSSKDNRRVNLGLYYLLLQPMHDDYDLRQEQMNKYSLLSSKKFLETLLETFTDHVVHSTGALVISAMLDFLTFSLCAPYSETTDGSHFDTLLEMVAANGRIVFKLFQVRLQKVLLSFHYVNNIS